jgi:hypothetical protein
MNFIEVFFGFSPDNNTGSTESAFVLVLFVGLGLLYFVALFKRARRRGPSL